MVSPYIAILSYVGWFKYFRGMCCHHCVLTNLHSVTVWKRALAVMKTSDLFNVNWLPVWMNVLNSSFLFSLYPMLNVWGW